MSSTVKLFGQIYTESQSDCAIQKRTGKNKLLEIGGEGEDTCPSAPINGDANNPVRFSSVQIR